MEFGIDSALFKRQFGYAKNRFDQAKAKTRFEMMTMGVAGPSRRGTGEDIGFGSREPFVHGTLSVDEAWEAHRIQRRLLPGKLPRFGNCDLYGSWLPAAAVGGDYYDVVAIGDSRVVFCIADVSGKGLPAALLMASIQASLRAVIRDTTDPAEICRRANRLVYESTTPERFVTFFIAVLDADSGEFQYSNAGHVAPVLLRADGSTSSLTDGGRALGFFRDGVWERGASTLSAGDRLVLFTDGLTEAENGRGEAFGDARLLESLVRNRSRRPVEFHDALFADARAFSGRLDDDASLLTVTAGPCRVRP